MPSLVLGQQNDVIFSKKISHQGLKRALSSDDYSEMEKAQMIYTYLSKTTRYDMRAFAKHKFHDYTPKQVVRKKKGLCGEFSRTFVHMARIANLKAYEVEGYVKENDYVFGENLYINNHSWVIFEAEGKLFAADPSSGSGFSYFYETLLNRNIRKLFPNYPIKKNVAFRREFTKAFFAVPPSKLISSHLPASPFHQLLYCPVPIDDFIKDITTVNQTDTCLDFVSHFNTIAGWNASERIIYESPSVKGFNANNHQALVTPALLGANENARSLILIDNPQRLQAKKKEILQEFAVVRKINSMFKEDLNKKKLFRIGAFSKRNSYLKSYLSSALNEDKRQAIAILRQKSSIKKENKRLVKIRSTKELSLPPNYSRIKPRKTDMHPDTIIKNINKNRFEIQANEDSIQFYGSLLKLYNDSLQQVRILEKSLLGRKAGLYLANISTIKECLIKTVDRRPLSAIILDLKGISENKMAMKEKVAKEMFEKKIFLYRRKINLLAQKNKTLIRDNQSLNFFSDTEDKIFVRSEELLAKQKESERTLNLSKINENLERISMLKKELKLLGEERKQLTVLMSNENYRFKSEVRNENLKYLSYLLRAEKLDKSIELTIRKINTSKYNQN